jgi:hypothetical protein
VRHRIIKYIGYFMIIGGTIYTVGTVIFWLFFLDYPWTTVNRTHKKARIKCGLCIKPNYRE